jgi:hypothetical protein
MELLGGGIDPAREPMSMTRAAFGADQFDTSLVGEQKPENIEVELPVELFRSDLLYGPDL